MSTLTIVTLSCDNLLTAHTRERHKMLTGLSRYVQRTGYGEYVAWQSLKLPVLNSLIKEIVLMEAPEGAGDDFTQLLVMRSAWKEVRGMFAMGLTKDNAKAVREVRKRLSQHLLYYRRWVVVPSDLLQKAKQLQRKRAATRK